MSDRGRPNVLLVVFDSVRAANVGLYGHEHPTTPFMESFAAEATVYEQARSPGTWSLPSHASMFSGLHVTEHGVTRTKHRLSPGNTVFERLADEFGYATGVFSENTWITDMDVGLKDAFDTVEGARNLPFPEAVDPSNFVLSEGQGKYLQFVRYCLGREDTAKSLANGVFTKLAWDYPRLLPDRFKASTPGAVYTDLFLDWEADREGPWAAVLNYMDGHMPYLPEPEHDHWGGKRLRSIQDGLDDQVWEFNGGQRPWWQRRALEGLYDGTIRGMDHELERLVSALRDRGDLEETLVVITSDHGEGFGEPSFVRPGARLSGHGNGIHEALLHVPLVVKLPGQSDPARVPEVASLTEFPRVVEAALQGDPSPGGFVPDDPVVASSYGLEEPMRERASKYCEDVYRFDGTAHAVYERGEDGVTKYETWRDRSATVVSYGPKCVRKVADTDEGKAAEVVDGIEERDVREVGEGVEELDAATEERLKDLGYI